MLECLDDAALRRWCQAGLAALRRHQREIDELNVWAGALSALETRSAPSGLPESDVS